MADPGGNAGNPRPTFAQRLIGLIQQVDLGNTMKNFSGDLSGLVPQGFVDTITQANIVRIRGNISGNPQTYTVLPADFIILLDTAHGPINVYLPLISQTGSRILIFIVLDGTNGGAVFPSYGSADVIADGSASIPFGTQNTGMLVFSGPGINFWFYFSETNIPGTSGPAGGDLSGSYPDPTVFQASGNFSLPNVGNGFFIKEGTNATMGTATLAGGTVVVATTKVTANSRIFLSVDGGVLTNVGFQYISARIPGTSFTITSSNALDSSNVAWVIVEPA